MRCRCVLWPYRFNCEASVRLQWVFDRCAAPRASVMHDLSNDAVERMVSSRDWCITVGPIFHLSVARIIFSLSGCLGIEPFLLCFLTFSSFLLMELNSTFLISPAFLMVFGTCLCLLTLLISGICWYLLIKAWSYSIFCCCLADLIPVRSEAFALHSRILPSSDPDKRNLLSGVHLAEKTLCIRLVW